MVKLGLQRVSRATAVWVAICLTVPAICILWYAADPGKLENSSVRPNHKSGLPAGGSLQKLPTVMPLEYLPLTREDALKQNEAQLAVEDIGPAARPFRVFGDSVSRARAMRCLTEAIYYEAASQDQAGQRAVAQVVLNRVRNPAFPASVCGVVYQGAERPTGCQFTFTCDGSLSRPIVGAGFSNARYVAARALAGYVFPGVGNATHYHADWVVPYWAPTLVRATKIGVHIFYRWKGLWGRSPGFNQKYVGMESDPTVAPIVVTKAMELTDPVPTALPDHLDLDKVVLAEDLRTIGLAQNPLRKNRTVLKADEMSGPLIPSLENKPKILADRVPPK